MWSIFNDLVTADLLLQYGGVEPEEASHNWDTIVHRDLKMENVFLDHAHIKREFPSYPTARVGDFGLAIITNVGDLMNPDCYNHGGGTRYCRAPEHHNYLLKKDLRPNPQMTAERLGSWTNVWGIGAIMIRLMNRDGDPSSPSFRDAMEEDSLDMSPDAARYSKELKRLVRNCVEYTPQERISLRELRKDILNATGEGPGEDLAQGMRSANHTGDDDVRKLFFQADEYKDRLARPDL